jgi:FKBP12-rapamycin complex-associated protein
MQFFALVNLLVSQAKFPLKEKMSIATYQVIPLTGSVGLIGWVPGCSTVYDVIVQVRTQAKIQVEKERLTLQQLAPKYESLTLTEKLRDFLEAVRSCDGRELKQILLRRANDSNHWIERRTTYTTSLAVTSMAGYILGLGDRHLCNIMMKRVSAKLVHIDFGDCFEVAMHRDRFPEKVPFRLTRILQNALEVSKIEGTFRTCCENIMKLMRQNSEQIVGLLEVFKYDPLLHWGPSTSSGDSSGGERSTQSAVIIVQRIEDKLNGCDIEQGKTYGFKEQVAKLIEEATSPTNLCVMFRGWVPWW